MIKNNNNNKNTITTPTIVIKDLSRNGFSLSWSVQQTIYMLRHNNKYNPLTSRAMLSKSGGSVTVSRHLRVAEAAAGACSGPAVLHKHQPPLTAASLKQPR